MSAAAARPLAVLKRRQAIQVTLFLIALAIGLGFLFRLVRGDLVAFRHGERAFSRGDFAGAAPLLERAWSGGYRTERSRASLARARLETGDRAGALELYEEALRVAPGDPALLDAVAGLYQAEGKPAEALARFARLGPPESLSEEALARLGDLRQQAGDFPGAADAYRLLTARAPRNAEAWHKLAVVRGWAGDRAGAIEAYRSALSIDGELRAARLQLARMLAWDGRFAEAVDEYRRALP